MTPPFSEKILDAATRVLPPCPKCKALRGDPCRTPMDKITKPHKEREELQATEVVR